MVLTEISGFYLKGRKQFYGKNPASSKGDRNTEKYKYPWQEPIQTEQRIRLASLHDIGAMKLHAMEDIFVSLKNHLGIMDIFKVSHIARFYFTSEILLLTRKKSKSAYPPADLVA